MLSKEEIAKKVQENEGLIRYIAANMGFCERSDFEDIISEGRVGLFKAASSYDEEKNIKFSTYASTCITNQIFMYLRRVKKHEIINSISLEEPIGGDTENITLQDMIEDPTSDFSQFIEIREEYAKTLYYILNYLTLNKKYCMLYHISGKKQKQIAEMIGISQSYVARIIQKSAKQIKKAVENDFSVNEEFSVEIKKDKYIIVFSSKEEKRLQAFLTRMLGDLKERHEKLPNLKFTCNNGKITVSVIASDEAFMFLAKFIRVLNEFEITLISKEKAKPNVIGLKPQNNKE